MLFSGERFIPGECDVALEKEHMNRYQFASNLVTGKRVVDIACGSGYGSAMMAKQAIQVTGIDISEEAIEYCQKNYQLPNLNYLVGNVAEIPLTDSSVDVVVSFETLEHVDEADQIRFMAEIRRILVPGGLLIVSTPNKDVYDERGDNEFHKHELSFDEFKTFLQKGFRNIKLCGQSTEVCNMILNDSSEAGFVQGKIPVKKAEYIIALASDGTLPEIAGNILPREDDYLRNFTSWARENDDRIQELSRWGKMLDETIAARDRTVLNLSAQVEEKDSQLAQATQQIADNQAQITVFSNRISELEKRDLLLCQIEQSRAWKVARGLQKVSGFVLPPNSRRRMMAHYVYKALRHPITMIKNMRGEKIACLYHKFIHGDTTYPEQTDEFKPQPIVHTKVLAEEAKDPREYEHLVFPEWSNPRVSIVIPVYNQFNYTYECLKSILRNTMDTSFEVILADDCSTDLTTRISEIVDNIHVIRTSMNLRFLLNCNNAAEHARGEYIFFLNNDTQVQEDWLGSLVRLMDSDDSIGMTGSKLVYPDGRLQEAGGILWKDGSAWNYGSKQDPNMPEYNYVKEVDYISGAAIMIRTSLWKQLGGFDERFAPAYYEDTDLAFMVREAGYRVVYQPKSVVVHFEGASNGTDTSSGLKKYQVDNQKRFYEKWKQVLEKHNPNGVGVFRARERSIDRPTLLFVDHYVPEFDKDAGSRSVFGYIKLFVHQGYSVKFIGDNFFHSEPYTTVLQQMGVEVLCGDWYYLNWRKWLAENAKYFDYAFLNRPHIAVNYIDILREHSNAKIAYYGHDLHYLRAMREYEVTKDISYLGESRTWHEKEFALMSKMDAVFYPSTVEVKMIHEEDPNINVSAIPVYLFEKEYSESYDPDKRKGLFFVGGFGHRPNVDAVKWLVTEIFPQVKKEIPDIELHIAGSKMPPDIKMLEGNGVYMEGTVSDERLAVLYKESRMTVVPLRYGAGVKGKVIESMYYGLPIVTTSCGAEGIEGGENVITVADEATQIAEKIIELYNNSDKLKDVSNQQKLVVKRYFSEDHAAESLSAVFEIDKSKVCHYQ